MRDRENEREIERLKGGKEIRRDLERSSGKQRIIERQRKGELVGS